MKKELYKKLENKIIEVQKGNSSAFSEVYDMTYQSVYFYALQMLRNKEDAEDIVQEVFEDALKTINTLEAPKAFLTWINKKTYFITMNYIRKSKRSVALDKDELVFVNLEEEDTEVQPEYAYLKDEKEVILMKGIEGLSSNHKNVILMHYYQNLSLQQISGVMECSVGTVKSRLNVARGYLKNVMAKNNYIQSGFFTLSLEKSIRKTLANMAKINTMNQQVGATSTAVKIAVSGSKLLSLTTIKVITASVATLIIGTTAVGSHLATKASQIEDLKITEIHQSHEGAYTNQGATIYVDTNQKEGEEIYALSETGTYYRGHLEKGGYAIKVSENGAYTIYAVSEGGADQKNITIKSIDNKEPGIKETITENNQLIITCEDDYSGIDWNKTMYVGPNGDLIKPTQILSQENKLIFAADEDQGTFKLYDQAGNSTIYQMEEQ